MIRMRYIIAVFLLLAFTLVLISVYTEVRSQTIAEFNAQQMLLAKQAAIGIERDFAQHYREMGHLLSFSDIIEFNANGGMLLDQCYANYNDSITGITRMNRDGLLIYTVPPNDSVVGMNISGQAHIQEILTTHKPVVSDVFTTIQGYQAIAYHVPVFNQGEFDGSLAFLIPFSYLTQHHLENIKPSAHGYAWVISQQGIELYCPLGTCAGTPIEESTGVFPSMMETAARMMAGQTETTTYSSSWLNESETHPVTMHAAIHPIQIGDTYWSICVAAPEREVLATMKGFTTRLILVAVLLCIVSLVYTFYVVRSWSAARELALQRAAEAEKAELTRRYMQAQKMEAVGRLAAGVAHDLNNMLTPILGYCELLISDYEQEPTQKEFLLQIQMASLRARDLVQQLLAFGRKQTLSMEVIDLNASLLNFEKLLRRTITESIDIELSLNAVNATIRGDAGSIEQAVLNLAINAQDSMPDGGRLTIETRSLEVEQTFLAEHPEATLGPHVLLSVSDTGHGIKRELHEKVFDPFFTTKAQGKGTGLGLASVHGIVSQHGGTIVLHSEQQRGSTFELFFPQAEGEPTALPPELHKPQIESVTGSILLAEDEPMVRKLTVDVLEQLGYTVHSAPNGAVALQVLESLKEQPDLLLTDVVMPDLNGRELARQVRARYPDIKVLFMSGHEDSVISEHGILDPDVPFLSKPFTVKVLREKVLELMSKDG